MALKRANLPVPRCRSPPPKLLQQQSSLAAALAEVLQRRLSARRIGRHRAEQVAKLRRRACVEATVCAARQPRNLAEGGFGRAIMTFLEQEGRHAENAKLS